MIKDKLTRIKIIYSFLKQYPYYVAGLTALAVFSALFDGFSIAFLFSVLNSMLDVDVMQSNRVFFKYINLLITAIHVQDKLIASVIFLIVSIFLKSMLTYLNSVFSSLASYRIWADIQHKVFGKYIKADYQFFLNHKQGEMLHHIIVAPPHIGALFDYVPQMMTQFLRLLVVGLVLFNISIYASLMLILLCLGHYYFTHYIARNISYKVGSGKIAAGERQNVTANEMVSGIRQIKIYSALNRWISEFYKYTKEYFYLARKETLWTPLPNNLLEVIVISLIAVLIIIVKVLNPANYLNILPILGTFTYAFQRIMPSMNVLGNLRIQLMGILPAIELLRTVLNEQSCRIKDGNRRIEFFSKEIRFEDIGFFYPGCAKLLDNFNVIFKKGKTTAIVGPSGAGKSTIADLIVRLFVPQRGRILIDNIDLKDIEIASWLKKIGFVTQDTFIFNATIAENIAFSQENIDMEKVITAAKLANAHGFIRECKDGYDTVVGDRGLKLSGGQRQRIAIARALYRNPEIIILDEATSSLDSISEKLIQDAINKISKDYTVIIIAHRLSTIVNADEIIVLDHGRIVDQGKHGELMSRRGVYKNLYNMQSSSGGN
ncbi:MAG: ABC transporter ATP-binding protein [Elusimicrobia bacterium]|nr:ABC transporter ATP-binding protein [Elusimicrobiota bacterium]